LLKHPTLNLLDDLGLHGMAKGFRDLADNPESTALGHAEWLGILLERESTLRQQKRFESRARTARLRHVAAVEDVDYRTPRGLDRSLFLKLASCDWIREHRHCLLTGPSGVGKVVARLRSWPQGLPGKPVGALSACAAAVCRAGAGPRRWSLREAIEAIRAGRSADP
jgi:hypothetical protein